MLPVALIGFYYDGLSPLFENIPITLSFPLGDYEILAVSFKVTKRFSLFTENLVLVEDII